LQQLKPSEFLSKLRLYAMVLGLCQGVRHEPKQVIHQDAGLNLNESHVGESLWIQKMNFTSTSLLKTFVFETEVKRKESQYLSRYAARMPQKTSHQVRHSSPLPLEPVADEMPLRILMDIKFAAHNLLASLMHHYHLQMSMSKTSLRKM
jgi:hypothetical protein